MRVAALTLGLLAALLCSVPCLGAVPGPQGLEGVGVAWAKDDSLLTVTIGHEIFHLTADTALLDARGEAVAFGAIPVARDASGQLLGTRQAAVVYRAAERRGRLYLEELRLLAD